MELSHRDIAILFWLGTILAYSMRKGDAGKALIDLIRAFFAPKLISPFALMLAYTAVCVWLLSLVDLWRADNTRTTLIWVGAFAFVTMMKAPKAKDCVLSPGLILKDAVTVTAMAIFLSDTFNFPLLVEFVLVPVVMLVACIQVLVDKDPEHEILRKPLAVTMGMFNVLIVGNGVWGAVTDYQAFASLNTAREFLVPVALSIMFLPFLAVFGAALDYENVLTVLSIRGQDPAIRRYARNRAIQTFGWNRDYIQRWRRRMILDAPKTLADVDAIMAELQEVRRRERHPLFIDPKDGWPPELARMFLAEVGFPAGDYHRSLDEWFAESDRKKIKTGVFDSSLMFSLAGNVQAVTRLKLGLTTSTPGDTKMAEQAFQGTSIILLANIGVQAPEQTLQALQATPELTKDGFRLVLAYSEWGNEKMGGYDRRLVIHHPSDNGRGDY